MTQPQDVRYLNLKHNHNILRYKYEQLKKEFQLYKKKRNGASVKIKLSIYKRDKSKCQHCCRDVEDDGNVHHLDGDRANNELDNLMLLCKECHIKLHLRKR